MGWEKVLCFVGGGLAVFVYGMTLASDAFQKVAGRRLRIILELLTANRLMGIGAGVALTMATQSSSATTVMLVSLANSGLLQLGQTLGVLLGADIGTTVTVQILAFHISDYALLMIAAGVGVLLLSRYERPKALGQVFMGFGFIFFGMSLMQSGMAPLQQSDWFRSQILALAEHPLRAFLISTLFTGMIHSSAATMAVAMTLASQGLLGDTPEEMMRVALPVVLGANVGTCATALMAGIGTNVEARRVAVAHLLIKTFGALLFFPLAGPFSALVHDLSMRMSPDASAMRLLANMHTAFNIAITLIFVGFTGPLARLILWLVPQRKDDDARRVDLLPLEIVDSEELALRSAKTALERLAGTVLQMFRDSIRVIEKDDLRLLEDVRRADEKVDDAQRQISKYLIGLLRRRELSEKDERQCKKLFIIASELEKIGNILRNSLMNAAYQKISRDIEYSIEGQKEFERMLDTCEKMLQEVVEMIGDGEEETERAARILALRRDVLEQQRLLQGAHIRRLRKGLRDSGQSSWCFLEMISILDAFSYRLASVMQAQLGTDVVDQPY
ncbi:MAG: Na/Pi cotransporter family protein [Elusimicrobiota bacterium]|jgi:phosphate:Na+ symporter